MNATLKRRSLMAMIAAAALALLLAAAPAWAQERKALTANDLVAAANQSITTVSIDEAKAFMAKPGVVIVDVREPEEVAKGKMAKAVNIPRGLVEFKAATELPDKDAPILIYCKVGGRGALAAEALVKMGYTNVVNLKGGWDAWIAAGNK